MPVIFERVLRASGNSHTVAIPPEILKALKITEGDALNIYVENGKIIIEKK